MINGSPKIKDSCSEYLIDEITKLLDNKTEVTVCNASDKTLNKGQFNSIYNCDAIVFVFPLYVDAIPSHLISFLEAFQKYLKEQPVKNISAYAVSNCGFFEGNQNKYALDIIENYCERTGLIWKYGLGIGAGPFIGESKSISWKTFIKKPVFNAMLDFKNSLETGEHPNGNIFVTAKIPRHMYIWAAHIGWRKQAKKNNLKTKDLYTKLK
ncbi:NAD(P)H-dependent oxidoreductase [Clostridium estertheticum]|uniref:NAD(P)H-dependent oxidoreductase n=1 Tax=Clostridium estertheticum TaxID=238834 RepID=UPI001C7DB92C|nr:NAD(P)H-dependent oxidoreductase [Clostridium estertheticum]MBX4262902.1 NAD(P)H-dependent oxidoreductase [Clostridium estertheticum]WLC68620.1 NAD(P)H-dependent oxidoreductase [Clostridium estertheticum]